MNDGEIMSLMAGFLNHRGYTDTLAQLRNESGLTLNVVDEKENELIRILGEYRLWKSNLAREAKRVNAADLSEEGDDQYPRKLLHTIDGIHAANILTVRLLPSGLLASGSSDKTVTLTRVVISEDSVEADIQNILAHHTGGVLAVEYNPADANVLLSGGMDGMVSLIDIASGEILQKFRDHAKYVVKVRWADHGNAFATASYDKSVCVYSRESDCAEYCLQKKLDFTTAVEAIAFNKGATELAVSAREDNYLYFVEMTSGSFTRSRVNMNAYGDDWVSFSAMELSYSPNNKYLLVSTDKDRLILFLRETGEQVRNFYGATNDEFGQPRHCWHPSGHYIFSTSQDMCIYIWDVKTEKTVAKLSGHKGVVRDISFVPDLDVLVSCGFDHKILVWK
eukprot:Opistho-2@86336